MEDVVTKKDKEMEIEMDISANRSFVLHLPKVVELAREAMVVLNSRLKAVFSRVKLV